MRKTLWMVVVGLGMVGCSSGPSDLCKDKKVSCQTPLICDPTDGVCKCGGRGGLVCPDGFNCDPVANTCQSTKCVGITCSAGNSCDVNDGTCKCGGTGGTVCAQGQLCDPVAKTCQAAQSCAQTVCPRNQACDPTSGQCVCGSAVCQPGQFCSVDSSGVKTCVQDLCSGVACVGNNQCDPTDGYCKCAGTFCGPGNACAQADAGLTCQPSSACTNVTCDGGTTCDPEDGQCKCGGPGGPLCGVGQLCEGTQCQGAGQCTLPDGGPVQCAGGTSCDPEDGQCKCGGRGGTVCRAPDAGDPGEICVSTPLQESCKPPCNPVSPVCPSGTYCFFDPIAATPAAYCAVPSDSKTENQSCATATSCFDTSPIPHSENCTGLAPGSTGICYLYCSVSAGRQGCPQAVTPESCVQIQGASTDVGFCQPQ